MKKFLFTMFLLLGAATLSAQPAGQSKDAQCQVEQEPFGDQGCGNRYGLCERTV
jgi:hypothetical protein